jgi:hypothetical protein
VLQRLCIDATATFQRGATVRASRRLDAPCRNTVMAWPQWSHYIQTMRKRSRTRSPKQQVDLSKARETARELRQRRGRRLKEISLRDRQRYLGHFGPPVKSRARKRGGRKGAKKRAA